MPEKFSRDSRDFPCGPARDRCGPTSIESTSFLPRQSKTICLDALKYGAERMVMYFSADNQIGASDPVLNTAFPYDAIDHPDHKDDNEREENLFLI